jgi:hypothetical protein
VNTSDEHQRIRELVDLIDTIDSGQSALRGRFAFAREMETAIRDFHNNAGVVRLASNSGTLPTAIEMNLLRYSVAAIQQGLQMMSAKSNDEELRELRTHTDRLLTMAADAPIRSIVPRLRKTRHSNPETQTTAECPGCGQLVIGRVENGQVVISFEPKTDS